MPTFHYRALTAGGQVVTGELGAASQPDAIEAIRNLGYYPIAATNERADSRKPWIADVLARPLLPMRTLPARSLAIMTQELAALLKAGLELDHALEILSRLDETKSLRPTIESVLERVRNGSNFADALAATPGFKKFYVSMARAGEHGGQLPAALDQLGEYLSRSQATREAIVSALVYPAVLLATAGLALIVVLVFVLPQFAPLFADAGKQLPMSTRVVMTIGDFLTDWGWALLLGCVVAFFAIRRALQRKDFRLAWDRTLLRLPVLGRLSQKIEVERFSRMLGALLANAVTLPDALAITADTLGNESIAESLRGAAVKLRGGDSLARCLEGGTFPPLAIDLVRIGEETGQLPEMLMRQADLYDRDVRHTLDRLISLLVPGLTIALGALVAGLITSILMAVIGINDLAT